MRLRIGIAALVVLFMLALPVASAAAESRVPPGVSGANQYTETLPGPGGNGPTGGGGSGQTPAQTIGKGNAAKLEALGPEGKAAAELAAETAPGGANGVKTGGQGGAASNGGGSGGSGTGSGSSGLDQVLGQVTGTGGSGSGGMGLLLPLLIAAAIVVAAAYAVGRRRAARPQD